MILLPLRPASLMHKNAQRHKIICGMHPIANRMHRSMDRHEGIIVEYPVCVISVAVLGGCCETMLIFPVVFVVLYNGRSIFLSQ